MQSCRLVIEELNQQQAWLIIGSKQTRMLRVFNVEHSQRNMSKRKQPYYLLPSEIAMNL